MKANVASPTSYLPSGYYWRNVFREARTRAELDDYFHALLLDHENLRQWVRERGLAPPKFFATQAEMDEKPLELKPPPGAGSLDDSASTSELIPLFNTG
jgi:hypothetical protein